MRRQRQRRRLDFDEEIAKKAEQHREESKPAATPGARPDLNALHQTLGNAAVGRLVGQDGIAEARKRALAEDFTDTPAALEAEIEAVRGQGDRLPPQIEDMMVEATGSDLSGIRVHTGADAEALSASLGALAFTRGQDLFFGHRAYDPESEQGQAVLAHELTHAAEQQSGMAGVQRMAGAAPPLTAKPSLSPGQKGAAVIELQTLLNQVSCEHHPALNPDGDYGMKTTVAVACFQWRMGLEINGECGQATWTALQMIAATTETEPPEPEEM